MKRTDRAVFLAAMGGVLMLSTTARAGSGPEVHDGFYFRLSPNLGLLSVSESYEGAGVTSTGDASIGGLSFGGDLLFGGTPAAGLVIGGGLLFGTVKDPKIEAGSISVTASGTMLFVGAAAFANYYFDPTQGAYLQGMLGFATVDFVSSGGTSGGNDPSGPMFGFGGGYDFWIGDQWSIGPTARLVYAPLSVEAGGITAKDNTLYLTLGAAFTLH